MKGRRIGRISFEQSRATRKKKEKKRGVCILFYISRQRVQEKPFSDPYKQSNLNIKGLSVPLNVQRITSLLTTTRISSRKKIKMSKR